MSAGAVEPVARRPVLLLLGALSLVLGLGATALLVHGHGTGALRRLGLPSLLRYVISVAELLGVVLLWPRRTMVAGAWLLAAVLLTAGAIHAAAGEPPLEFLLYFATVYAVVRLRPPAAN